jgi:hypothetical protein
MSVKTVNKPAPAAEPALPWSPLEPTSDLADLFPPSAELGEQLQQLHKAQTEVDRRNVAKLARLREIQDRD